MDSLVVYNPSREPFSVEVGKEVITVPPMGYVDLGPPLGRVQDMCADQLNFGPLSVLPNMVLCGDCSRVLPKEMVWKVLYQDKTKFVCPSCALLDTLGSSESHSFSMPEYGQLTAHRRTKFEWLVHHSKGMDVILLETNVYLGFIKRLSYVVEEMRTRLKDNEVPGLEKTIILRYLQQISGLVNEMADPAGKKKGEHGESRGVGTRADTGG